MPLTLPLPAISGSAVPNLGPVAIVPTTVTTPIQVFQGLPERAWLVAQGNSYGCVLNAGITTAALLPTTKADLTIVNGEFAGGKSYIIDRVFAFINVTAAAATQLAIFGQIVPVQPAFAVTADDATILRWSLNGRATSTGSKVRLGQATPTTPVAAATRWAILGQSASGAAANVATAVDAPVYGRYVLVPGAAMCFTAVTGTVTGASGAFVGLEWHEVQLPIA